MVFLNSLFGYLSFLILQKWATGDRRLKGGRMGGELQGWEGQLRQVAARGKLQLELVAAGAGSRLLFP